MARAGRATTDRSQQGQAGTYRYRDHRYRWIGTGTGEVLYIDAGQHHYQYHSL